jgi:hypothetical protein
MVAKGWIRKGRCGPSCRVGKRMVRMAAGLISSTPLLTLALIINSSDKVYH